MHKILVIDTSMLCTWLNVPGKETCGTSNDLWDKTRVSKLLEKEERKGARFVLPLAVIIETGNHISQSQKAWDCANKLCDIIKKSLDSTSPWVAFSQQEVLWSSAELRKLANEWPNYAKARFSLGDMTIKTVAEYYAEMRYEVHILTGDAGLKAYEPQTEPLIPRRHMDKAKK
jgi:hypothetical protein